jgi:hypothetical protein
LNDDLRVAALAEQESWLRKSEQGDKWIFCLTTARIAAYQERQ